MSAGAMVEESMLTIDQVARKLGYHRNTVRKWILSGELTASRPGGRDYRIRERDLEAFITRTQIKPKKAE